ncbi:hypothetical protein DL546_000831 [Coniochaeta pulveracea]|uniref:Cytochrome b561 domain-containing protein n=1 Tax=Coniochaeta pulveracea TaxID=177199 RepID=A0A420XWB5_9PEZI|nr:hypothetical protein DL546_000831 [Coniochaeta pulveracea]
MRFAKAALGVTIGRALAQGSIFVEPQHRVAFGVSIPDNSSSNDIYFSLAAASNLKWAGVGLGSSEMKGALFLIIYSSASGAKVTLSARTVSDHVEPMYDSEIHIEPLSGTGIANGTMTFSGRCTNCRSWSGGGSIDVSSDDQDCIFAFAPGGPMNSDDFTAPLNYHTSYGSFSINLKQATSWVPSPPLLGLSETESSSGATLLSDESTQNWVTIIHAVIMVGCFIGMLPLGAIFLRVMNKIRWHAINQSFALVGIMIGTGLGIYTSLRYTRSKSFNTAHQVIGLLVAALMVVQFLLGFVHHRLYKQTQQTTKLAPVHVWLGRILIIASVVVAFLGFPLALSENGQTILAVFVVLATVVTGSLLLWKWYSGKRRRTPVLGETDATSHVGQGRRKFVAEPQDTAMVPLRLYATTERGVYEH